jgi:RNA polymerase sigma-70 factor (ECF subfamily)
MPLFTAKPTQREYFESTISYVRRVVRLSRRGFRVEAAVVDPADNVSSERTTQFIKLLTSHQPNLYAYISAMVLGDTAVPDILQETNLHLWEQASQYDFSRPFLPWAFAFARQRVLAFRKSCSRSRLVFDDATLRLIDDKVTYSVSEIDDRLSALTNCLKKLSPPQAELIRERYMAKDSVTAIAERLNQTAHNISSQLHRIRKILAKCIEFTLSAEQH